MQATLKTLDKFTVATTEGSASVLSTSFDVKKLSALTSLV